MEELMFYLKLLNEELLKISRDEDKVEEWLAISAKYPSPKYCTKEQRCEKAIEEEKFLARYTSLKTLKTEKFTDKDHILDSRQGDLALVNRAGFALFFDLKVGSNSSVCGAISYTSYYNFIRFGVFILINANFSRWYILPKRVLQHNIDKWSFTGNEIREYAKFNGFEVFRNFPGVIYTETKRGR